MANIGRIRRRWRGITALAAAGALLLVGAGCSQDGAWRPETTLDDRDVTGIVGSVEPAEPGIGVLAIRNGVDSAVALTDESGRFRLAGLLPGEYGLVATGAGYFIDTSVRTLRVAEGQETIAPPITMRALTASATLRGTVTNAAGAPFAGVRIAVICRSAVCAPLSALTNDGGEWQVDVWSELSTTLVYTFDGFRTESSSVPALAPGRRGIVPRVVLIAAGR
ncbi:carboxypeptidase regulatory-like domain-containing protein [Candidatus Poribacteria bacterium]|nr:carboxypeptidase regulatory-like domain-containing protein [Candidatus Poribacteria bacterium]